MAKRLRVYVPGLAEGSRLLPAEAGHYVSRVHRLAAGDRFTAFDPEAAKECTVTVLQVQGGRVECAFGALRAPALVGALPVTLLQAPGKSERMEEVVRAATALGVRAVHVLRTERSVFVPSSKHLQRLRSIAVDGARQSGRGDLPELLGPNSLGEALASLRAPLRVCLHPRADVPLETCVREHAPGSEVALCVGPEGGFTDEELGVLDAAGFRLAALGPLTLRAELASVAALGFFAARLPGEPNGL